MRAKPHIRFLLLIVLLTGWLNIAAGSVIRRPARSADVTAFDLIIAMNTLRVSNGLPALIEDPIINAVAQSTAEIMAANQMSSHLGDVRGRLAAAGYGGGATVWATENFAVGMDQSIDRIMLVWSDAAHMIPAVNPAYCHVGAGVAKSSNGRTYYVLQAAYTSAQACGEYKSVAPGNPGSGPGGSSSGQTGVSQLIYPVKIAKPDADGKIFHVVEAGQSFWSIAIAYKVTIQDIETWNNISRNSKLQIGQKLFIPSSNTEGYATPTPVGMIQISTPDSNGKIVHTVREYQTLITIAEAYQTKVDTLLALNGIQTDWPLQIDQQLLIDLGNVTPTPTPQPLSPIEKLTPESDGNYYHTVQSGETLYWIASLYEISVSDLMVWNGLNGSSVLYPDQKLILQVTPPATLTPTPEPPTSTPTPTKVLPSPTISPTIMQTAENTPLASGTSSPVEKSTLILIASLGVVAGASFLIAGFTRRKQ